MASTSSNQDVEWKPKFKNKFCYCGRKALLKISETQKHPDMLFYKCDKCKYFSWWNDDLTGNVDSSSNTGVLRNGGTDDNGSEWLDAYHRMNERVAKVEANLNGVYAIVGFMVIVFVCVLFKL